MNLTVASAWDWIICGSFSSLPAALAFWARSITSHSKGTELAAWADSEVELRMLGTPRESANPSRATE